MSLGKIAALSLRGLWRNRFTTLLMTLGVIAGIATLIVVFSLSEGASRKVMHSIENFGPGAVMVSAGEGKLFGPPDNKTTTLTLDDALAIKRSVPGIRHIAPFSMNLDQTIVYGGRNTTAAVIGATPEFTEAWQWQVEKGDFISDGDNAVMARNCVLGRTVMEELFGDMDAVGEIVKIENTYFKVVGIMSARGTSPHGMDMDRRVYVPLTTAMKKLYNVQYIGMIRVYVDKSAGLDEITGRIAALLRERHRINPPREDDFLVTNSLTTAGTVGSISDTLKISLFLLSLISLTVGGIVIANIMLIAVNERSKEIGIRRASGASTRDILYQFLGEALLISLAGGIAGILLGIGVSLWLAQLKKLPVAFSLEPVFLSVALSAAIGIVAGLLPAKRAAAHDPAEAMKR